MEEINGMVPFPTQQVANRVASILIHSKLESYLISIISQDSYWNGRYGIYNQDRLSKEEVTQRLGLCLHVDEVNEIVRDEFVTLLNKAGGAGVRVTAYTQTVNDLGAAFSGNSHKSKMISTFEMDNVLFA